MNIMSETLVKDLFKDVYRLCAVCREVVDTPFINVGPGRIHVDCLSECNIRDPESLFKIFDKVATFVALGKARWNHDGIIAGILTMYWKGFNDGLHQHEIFEVD